MNNDRRAKMVGWYDPSQLTRTGIDVLISTIFGKYSDQRQMQALASGSGVIYDFTTPQMTVVPVDTLAMRLSAALTAQPDGQGLRWEGYSLRQEQSGVRAARPFWFDFVADVGDGWEPTYTVAYCLAHPSLPVRDPHGKPVQTQRGEILIFGGDECYPVANREAYEQRLVAPYRDAFNGGPYPTVFAVPGNHDWYDNLVSFSRLFCSHEPFAGQPAADPDQPATGCQTPQRRSYFALKLPGNWWLLGTDVQLGSDIDGPQYDFFKKVYDLIKKEPVKQSIILCTPEPHWVYAEALPMVEARSSYRALKSLEALLGNRVRVWIAGDVHHYQRYEGPGADERRPQKITSGGGGAFLHPTHGTLNVKRLSDGNFERRESFPSTGKSWAMGWRNLLFPVWNWRFGVVPGTVYMVLLWFMMPMMELLPPKDEVGLYAKSFWTALYQLFVSPALPYDYLLLRVLLWVIACATIVAFYLFTDLPTRHWRWPVAAVHGLVHYFAAVLLAWFAASICFDWLWNGEVEYSEDMGTFWQIGTFIVASVIVFFCGWLTGSIIMGLYLLVMLNFLNRHWNEGFSSLRITGWKNFLRMQIDEEGTLRIFPIGIEKLPKWPNTATPPSPENPPQVYQPIGNTLDVKLIEGPIVVRHD